MKVFVNLLIETDAYDDSDKILDAVVAELEEEGFKVPWFKVKEADR